MGYIDVIGKKKSELVGRFYVSGSELREIQARDNPYGDPVVDDDLFSNLHKYRRR